MNLESAEKEQSDLNSATKTGSEIKGWRFWQIARKTGSIAGAAAFGALLQGQISIAQNNESNRIAFEALKLSREAAEDSRVALGLSVHPDLGAYKFKFEKDDQGDLLYFSITNKALGEPSSSQVSIEHVLPEKVVYDFQEFEVGMKTEVRVKFRLKEACPDENGEAIFDVFMEYQDAVGQWWRKQIRLDVVHNGAVGAGWEGEKKIAGPSRGATIAKK